MKGAYFWIQLGSQSEHYPKQTYQPPISSRITSKNSSNLTVLNIEQPNQVEQFSDYLKSIFINAKQFLVNQLTRSPKLKVRSYLDRKGNTWWHVYDPITRETGYLSSEAEVQDWLNQHYYPTDKRFFN